MEDHDNDVEVENTESDFEITDITEWVEQLPEDYFTYLRRLLSESLKTPLNLEAWMFLISETDFEKVNKQFMRDIFNNCLYFFPTCHLYWLLYASLEASMGTSQSTIEVYKRAVISVGALPVVWESYIHFQRLTTPHDKTKIRSLYNEAIRKCGYHYNSDALWSQFVTWERCQGNLKTVTDLYVKKLTIPTADTALTFADFCKHVTENSIVDLLAEETIIELSNACIKWSFEVKQGMEELPGSKYFNKRDLALPNETDLKKSILTGHKAQFYGLMKSLLDRTVFEQRLTRTLFTGKNLLPEDTESWENYLDYAIKEDSEEAVVQLFQRCLIACARSSRLWKKYISYVYKRRERWPHLLMEIRILSHNCTDLS